MPPSSPSSQTGFVRQLWLGASAVVLLGFGIGLGLLTMALDHRVSERHLEALALSKTTLEVQEASSQLRAWHSRYVRDLLMTAAFDPASASWGDNRSLIDSLKTKLATMPGSAADEKVAGLRKLLDELSAAGSLGSSLGAGGALSREQLIETQRRFDAVESQLTALSAAVHVRMRELEADAESYAARKRASRTAFAVVTLLATFLLIAMTIRTMRSNNLVLDRLSQLAQEDALTGITNRRGLDEMLPVEFARARRSGQPLAFVMMDLDLFKKYNDRRGHAAGDALLRGAAQAWARQLRPTDLIARYGGEEFTLVLPSCDSDQAAQLVDRLRILVPDHQTFSAGIATWDGEESASQLLQRADQALLQAKKGGRNRTMIAGREPQTTLPLQMA